MIVLICFLAFIAFLLLFAMMGRKNAHGLQSLQGWSYAHRGLHGPDDPENSMPAFRKALDGGFGIELDIHLMKDGNLAVIHDSSLLRTAGVDVKIEDLTVEDLPKYRLMGTQEQIPLFADVLALFDGKAPLIVELKTVENHEALCKAACNLLDQYHGAFCVESFDPRCIIWLRKHRPNYIRGQLAENFLVNPNSKLPLFLKWVMSWNMSNFLSSPDFIAYKFADRNHFTVKLCRKVWGIQGITWTLRNKDDYNLAVSDGWIPIFENFVP